VAEEETAVSQSDKGFVSAAGLCRPRGRGAHESGRPWRRRLTPVLALAVVALAAFLLYRTLSRYEYDELVASVVSVPAFRLSMAIGFAVSSYICLSFFDLLALRYVGRSLPYRNVALASFCSLSLGHNIGFAALSSGTIRYRFYSRFGLHAEEIAKVILFCGVTVGLGLATLAGIALAVQPRLAEQILHLDRMLIHAVAALCLAMPVVYFSLAITLRAPLRFRTWSVGMPSPPVALSQVAVGTVNFALVAGCLHQALSGAADIPYVSVASVYVIANVATLITHVPGGLGVIESVVLFLLPQVHLIGAVLVFRFVYFLLPLPLGGTLFAFTELRLRLSSGSAAANPGRLEHAAKIPAATGKP
jgi:glycosyltransferase 2 family protein